MSAEALNAHDTGAASRDELGGAFRDPNEVAAREVSMKLLREILEYQRRLDRLLERGTEAHTYLVNAYRRAIRVRREMLRDLPLPFEGHALPRR